MNLAAVVEERVADVSRKRGLAILLLKGVTHWENLPTRSDELSVLPRFSVQHPKAMLLTVAPEPERQHIVGEDAVCRGVIAIGEVVRAGWLGPGAV